MRPSMARKKKKKEKEKEKKKSHAIDRRAPQ
jgi:hypothetical protein